MRAGVATGSLLVLPLLLAVVPPGAAHVGYNDGHTIMAGVVTEGDVDSSRNATQPQECVPGERHVVIKVRVVPPNPGDFVRVEVLFVERAAWAVLDRNHAAIRFEGTAPDSCFTPAFIKGVRAPQGIPYVLTQDEPDPPQPPPVPPLPPVPPRPLPPVIGDPRQLE